MNFRLFAALDPTEEARDRLAALRRGLPEGRLTERESLHLTLAFFGEADGRKAEDLHAALGALKLEAFDWRIDGTGFFGEGRPRILFAAVPQTPPLNRLHESVVQAGRIAGFDLPAERFRPHLTLKRLQPGEMTDRAVARWLEATGAFLHGPIHAGSFALYRSIPGRAGPFYEALARYPLMAARR